MHRDTQTIAAIASPVGTGGVGIVRISGPQAKAVLSRIFLPLSSRFVSFKPWTLHRGRVLDIDAQVLDEVLAVFMPGPRSFTGEDVAEIHCHGGLALLAALLESICAFDVRLAEAGEFSKRAFLNGRMDLAQAEAVAELIAAPGKEAVLLSAAKLDGLLSRKVDELRARLEALRMELCVAIDFPEEEHECLGPELFVQQVDGLISTVTEVLAGRQRNRCWHEGALIVLAGGVNVGKSSLMNALLGRERALVTPQAGTTRDFIEEKLLLGKLPVRLVDTAGLRESRDELEQLGMAASRRCIEEADLVLLLIDSQKGLDDADLAFAASLPAEKLVLIWNKSDLAKPARLVPPNCGPFAGALLLSAKFGHGLDQLTECINTLVLHNARQSDSPATDSLSPNLRQAQALSAALGELELCKQDVLSGQPYDLCGLRLDSAGAHLAQITGLDSSEELLNRVFSSFCIGK